MHIRPNAAHVFFNGRGSDALAKAIVAKLHPSLASGMTIHAHDVPAGWSSEADIQAYSTALLLKSGAIPQDFQAPGVFAYETQKGSARGQSFFVYYLQVNSQKSTEATSTKTTNRTIPPQDVQPDKRLLEAAGAGDIKKVAALLKPGWFRKAADVNTQLTTGETALITAAASRHYEIMEFLLEKGADVNARSNLLGTALHLVSGKNAEMVARLLAMGANPRVGDAHGRPCLVNAVGYPGKAPAEMLLSHGADVHASTPDKLSPLHQAVRCVCMFHDAGDVATVKLLLEKGANPHAKDASGKTPLDYALDISKEVSGNANLLKRCQLAEQLLRKHMERAKT
jgi:ankyrin repeat protein